MPQEPYKVIRGSFDAVESEINKLAAEGWKVVSSASGGEPGLVVVILEKR